MFRAGIESIHPSQLAAARSLGLTYRQTMRHVVLPQAVRRVAPPLLNDTVALQKDVGLVSLAGPIDAVRAAQIATAETFNYTPYIVAGVLFVLLAIPLIAVTDWVTLRAARRQAGADERPGRSLPWRAQGVRRHRCARRTRPRRRRARGRGADRGVRLGQVDAAALRQPAGAEFAFRAQVLFDPTDTISALLNLHARDIDSTASIFRANVLGPGSNGFNSNYDRDSVSYDGDDKDPNTPKAKAPR